MSKQVLDALGVAITNAGYTWTPEMRSAYEKGIRESEWVGLTRDEIDYCFEQCVVRKFKEDGTEEGIVSIYKAVEVIEAELKEKNT